MQRVLTVDQRRNLTRLDQFLERDEIVGAYPGHERRDASTREHRSRAQGKQAPEQHGQTTLRSASRHERSRWDEDLEAIAEWACRGDVEEHIEALSLTREVLASVVDDPIRTERADDLQVPSTGHRGDVGAERLCDLHRKSADTAARTVNEDALPGLDTCRVAKTLERRDPCHRQRGRLLKRQPRRLGSQPVFLRARVLGERAGCDPEHRIAPLEASDVPANRLDGAREVHATHGDSRAGQAEEHAGDERHVNEVRVEGVDGGRMHPNEYAVIRDSWQPDLAQLQNVD